MDIEVDDEVQSEVTRCCRHCLCWQEGRRSLWLGLNLCNPVQSFADIDWLNVASLSCPKWRRAKECGGLYLWIVAV